MSTSASMVKAMVMKGGGVGGKRSMTCAQILAAFSPPIKFGSHADMVGTKKGYQAEHIIPTSAAHDSGRSGPRVPGCEGYSTSGALTWMVGDGQSAGAEHKILTDPMREFSQSNDLAGESAPLSKWLDKYEKGAQKALTSGKPKRTVKDKNLDRASLVKAAAKCIRLAAEESFRKMKPPVRPSTPMRNPWPATSEQREAAASAVKGAGRGRVM